MDSHSHFSPFGLGPQETLAYRKRFRGMISVASKIPLKDRSVLSLLYTPGVAAPCLAIAKEPLTSFDYTLRGNTIALVSDVITAHALPPITMKGISREVVPYSVDSIVDGSAEKGGVVIERMPGLDFYLDPSVVKSSDAERIRSVLKQALASLEKSPINLAT